VSEDLLGPGQRTRVRRLAKKARYDAATIDAILDEARMCHVAGVVGGLAMTMPTLHAREGRTLYLHASKSNALLRSVLERGEACVTATLYDGLRLARSAFESSIAYRSVVVVGPATEVRAAAEKRRILDLLVNTVLAGRADEVRPMSDQEVKRTLVVRVEIAEASAKVSAGPTDDDDGDQELAIWSGTVPARLVFGVPRPDVNGAMASGDVALPASVRRLLDDQA
jgi:nitroimidazol reductase NimA-like FMN-containing flavoprotein (pyridoxamine 5'-phosphate oxidase superfamily)